MVKVVILPQNFSFTITACFCPRFGKVRTTPTHRTLRHTVPFHRLHCYLQYRLRELVTPVELYHLQLALGSKSNYLHPLQPCKLTDECESFHFGKNAPWYRYKASDLKDNIILIKYLFIVDYLSEDYMETIRLLQAYAILEVETVTFEDDVFVDATVLHRIAPLCSKECIDIDMNVENVVSFKLVFDLFPNVIVLDINVGDMENWLNDLIDAKVTEISHIHVFLPPPRDVDDLFGDLDVKALYEFCAAQDYHVSMRMTYATTYESFEDDRMWDYLKPYFCRYDDKTRGYPNLQIGNYEQEYQFCYADGYELVYNRVL